MSDAESDTTDYVGLNAWKRERTAREAGRG
jgi:hypothetical protein